jgi:anti-sigma28 factor (negative regulator of flagellin synthesis)
MEEAIADSTLDLNLPPAKGSVQAGVQRDTCTNRENQAQFLIDMQKSCQAASQWPQNRAARVEILRKRVISGVYHVDSTELAQCIWDNSTHFLEADRAVAETS